MPLLAHSQVVDNVMVEPFPNERVRFKPSYSLAHLTLLGCPAPELVYIAARTGYDAVSLRLIPMGVAGECPYPPLNDELIRSTRLALEVTGIGVHDIELLTIREQCDVASYESAMAVGAELGAKYLVVSAWTNDADDQPYLVDKFSEICERAQAYGLFVVLEFPSFSRLKDMHQAAAIIQAANQSNGGMLIDTLYLHLSRVATEDIGQFPGHWFPYIQVSDVLPGIPDTCQGMVSIARDSRLYPGEGCIDFPSVIAALPPVNYSIELPNRSRVAELGYEEHARRCIQMSKQLFEPVEHTLASTGLSSNHVVNN